MPNEKQYIRIFIGSPSDVTAEREIAYKVLSDVESIFQSLKDYGIEIPIPPLRAIGWEQVPPGVGLPNKIILERFPIEESHIFIFILWKRFGSQPGTRRENGGRYGSGTQEEFERAFLANSRKKTGTPFIMIYQKKDEFSITNLSPKEIGQYRKVVEFIEECQPGGKHPALTRPFFSKDFEGLLRENLLDIILKMSVLQKDQGQETGEDETSSAVGHIGQSSSPTEEEHPELLNWLVKNSLSANPFKHHTAENENEKDITKYYVPFKGFPLIANDILQGGKNWLFFGKEGSGKTTLKRFILSRCAPSRPNSNTLTLAYETSDFLEALEFSANIKTILLYIAGQILVSASSTAEIPVRKRINVKKFSEPATVFIKLGRLLHEAKGYEQTLCLLDLADDISGEYISILIEVLSNLISLPTDKIGFRLFLPKHLQTKFIRQDKYLGKCDLREIQWDEERLKELIKQRLIYFSINKANPNHALATLCEPKGKMRSIDEEIVTLSQGRPRAAVWLANQLLLEHCQNDPVPPQISPLSWDKVLSDWWATGRNLILGTSGNTETFSTSGTDVYFRNTKLPLKLSKRSKLLIKPLVEAEGQICSKDELIHSAWPGVNSDGVTEAAVREAIRRLKIELEEKNGVDPAWVKTIHGQGYQLLDPQGIAIEGNTANSVIINGSHNKVNLRVEKRANKEDT